MTSDPSDPPGVRAAKLPPFASVEPQLASLAKEVPAPGTPFVYEIKYDGYRAMAWLEDGKVRIASRKGLDWTRKYETIAAALSRVRARTALFDGEVAYVRDDGRTDFQSLQNALGSTSAKEKSRLVYFVFDLLHYDGVDLREAPLSFRKDKLRTILAGEELPLKMSDDVSDGSAFFREVCKIDLEGIIGKRTDRPYRSGRSTDWIKLKCQKRQEMIVVGFTPPKGTRRGIGALVLAVLEGKSFRYAGKVGTGFSIATLRDLEQRLGKLVVKEPVVADPPRLPGVTWVKPELVAQVRFTEWSSDGVLRHPSFEGLREDKDAREVHREVPKPLPRAARKKPAEVAPGRPDGKPRVDGVLVSHPERVIDEESKATKLDLVRYFGAVAERMLPFVMNRPLMLFRCPLRIPPATTRPTGSMEKRHGCFVQKHSGQGLDHVNLGTTKLGDEEGIFVTTTRQLVTLAQNNTVEVHGWGSRVPEWQHPDWIVLDLDPGDDVPFGRVIDAALEVRDALRTLRLESWVKTTGGKGLHVVVPLRPKYGWETVRRASRSIAVLMARAAPDRYVANMSKKQREGKIYLDYLRNAEGATAVLPYSPRARPGLTVAMPVAWRDLRSVDPRELTIARVLERLARRSSDPWADLLETKQALPRELVAATLD